MIINRSQDENFNVWIELQYDIVVAYFKGEFKCSTWTGYTWKYSEAV
jgi:hypothetical protein